MDPVVESEAKKFAVCLNEVNRFYSVETQNVVALRDLNLKIEPGCVVAVTGRSGAGKSTLLHIVGTLEKPSTGQLFLNDVNVSSMPDSMVSAFRNSTIGFIFQMNNLLAEFTALENVMMPGLISQAKAKDVKERARVLLQAVGLEARLNHRPGEMSGGEQQRVAIARALLMAPSILLADEPTGNLDQKTSRLITDMLFALCQDYKMTMLLVTHDLELAGRFSKQVVMEDGRIIKVIGSGLHLH